MRRLVAQLCSALTALWVAGMLCGGAAAAADELTDDVLARIAGSSTRFPCCGERHGVYCTGVTKECVTDGDQCKFTDPWEKWGCVDEHESIQSTCTAEGFQMVCCVKGYCDHSQPPYPNCAGDDICPCAPVRVMLCSQMYWHCGGTDCPIWDV